MEIIYEKKNYVKCSKNNDLVLKKEHLTWAVYKTEINGSE